MSIASAWAELEARIERLEAALLATAPALASTWGSKHEAAKILRLPNGAHPKPDTVAKWRSRHGWVRDIHWRTNSKGLVEYNLPLLDHWQKNKGNLAALNSAVEEFARAQSPPKNRAKPAGKSTRHSVRRGCEPGGQSARRSQPATIPPPEQG